MENNFGIRSLFKPTPTLFRKIGTAIASFCLGVVPIIMQSNLSPETKICISTWIGVIGLAAKCFTNFFGEK